LPHHRTLLSSVEWSYQLLSEEARVLLRRASVFVGGWTLEATEAICGDRTLDPLAELVDASLVLADPLSGRASRYGLLETIREYAAERLREAGEEAELRRRHRDWFLDLAERAAREHWGPRQIEAYDRLAADLDNLRAALDWTVAIRDGATALRLAAALWRF
jgi:predicted ATPase